MSNSILNIITQLLSYSDSSGTTDNPQMQNFNWTRRLASLPAKNPSSDTQWVPAGQSYTIFDGIRSNPLDATSVLSLALVSNSTNVYKMTVTAGTSGFRTPRTITSLGTVNVTINNNSVAAFEFVGATLTGVVVGDVLRISGTKMYDTGPFAFNSLNAGLWTVIAVSGNTVQAVRPVGKSFEGVTETGIAAASTDVEIYSSAGVQAGDKMDIASVFSSATQRVYEVKEARPSVIVFMSAVALPTETGVAYPDPIPSGHSIIFYTNSKKIVYVEVDQDAVVRLNGDTGDTNKLTPVKPCDPTLVGYFHKYGDTYKLEVVNKSVNPLKITYFTAE